MATRAPEYASPGVRSQRVPLPPLDAPGFRGCDRGTGRERVVSVPMRISGVRSPKGPLFRPTTRHPSTHRLEPAPPCAGRFVARLANTGSIGFTSLRAIANVRSGSRIPASLMQNPADANDRPVGSVHDRERGIADDQLTGAGSLTSPANKWIEDQRFRGVTYAPCDTVCRLDIFLRDICPGVEVVAVSAGRPFKPPWSAFSWQRRPAAWRGSS